MRFTAASFNTFNLISPGVPYYGEKPFSQDEFARKARWMGERLRDIDAAIVGFQEVFDESALRQVMEQNALFADGTVVAPNITAPEPGVGLATSLPIVDAPSSIHAFPDEFALEVEGLDDPVAGFRRPLLRAKLKLNETHDVTVFVAHLKSKRPLIPDDADRDDPLEQARGQLRALTVRAVEAAALRALLVKELRGVTAPVIVMGDLNDDVDSVPLEIITGREPPSYWPKKHKQKAWDLLLYNTSTIQARRSLRDVGFSYVNRGRYDMLDHVLVSQEFYHRNPKRIGVVERVRYLNDHLIDRSQPGAPEKDRTRSDHGIVAAGLRLDR